MKECFRFNSHTHFLFFSLDAAALVHSQFLSSSDGGMVGRGKERGSRVKGGRRGVGEDGRRRKGDLKGLSAPGEGFE